MYNILYNIILVTTNDDLRTSVYSQCSFYTTKTNCSMTLCFSFEVFVKLNLIQVNIKRGGPKY